MQQLPLGVRLRERASFDSFVESSNHQAVHRLKCLVTQGSGVVWLWGQAGAGKSHLLRAVCAAAPAARRVLYLPLKDLADSAVNLLDGAGQLDILCIDDLEQAIGDLAFERALFSVYRRIEERGAGLVVTADRPPLGFIWRLADIGSRLGASEIFQLQLLDEEGQCQALQRHAAERGLELPLETARYLCLRLPRDLPGLIGVLERIDDASLSAQRRLTIPFMREVLGEP